MKFNEKFECTRHTFQEIEDWILLQVFFIYAKNHICFFLKLIWVLWGFPLFCSCFFFCRGFSRHCPLDNSNGWLLIFLPRIVRGRPVRWRKEHTHYNRCCNTHCNAHCNTHCIKRCNAHCNTKCRCCCLDSFAVDRPQDKQTNEMEKWNKRTATHTATRSAIYTATHRPMTRQTDL